MYIRTILALSLLVLLTGCEKREKARVLMNRQDYDIIVRKIFDPEIYNYVGAGGGSGLSSEEFSSMIYPKDKSVTPNLDLKEFDIYLKGKDDFTGTGNSDTNGLLVEKTWRNEDRYILVEAAWVKDGHVLVIYREILK